MCFVVGCCGSVIGGGACINGGGCMGSDGADVAWMALDGVVMRVKLDNDRQPLLMQYFLLLSIGVAAILADGDKMVVYRRVA